MALVWVDGRVRPSESATVAALDHGLTVGDGVFETCKIVDGEVFALSRHLRRLSRSAELLGIAEPDHGVVRQGVTELLAAWPVEPLGRLRITVTSGAGPLGSDRSSDATTLVLAVAAAKPWLHHIEVVTVPWPRNEHSAVVGAKTTSYAENVVALAAAHRSGGHEAVMPNTAGMLCEGAGSNVVVEMDGVLVTPPLSSGCLAGITRELFLEWAATDGLPVVEADVSMGRWRSARTVLLTSSTRDVQPVNVLDGRPLEVSELALRAAQLFVVHGAKGMDP
jgi:branched-chain amino acid aminotransferase